MVRWICGEKRFETSATDGIKVLRIDADGVGSEGGGEACDLGWLFTFGGEGGEEGGDFERVAVAVEDVVEGGLGLIEREVCFF